MIVYRHHMEGEGIKSRDVLVWLPPGYETHPDHCYPVLYMQDGQNVFDPDTSFIGVSWQAGEVAGRLMAESRIRKAIIVAVYNTDDRDEEYGDTEKGRSYMEFMAYRLKPFIDKTYRTIRGRDAAFVMGSSMGGLISFLLAWHYPHVFSRAACLSPTFLYGPNNIIPLVREYRGSRKAIRVYIDNGSEGLDRELQKGCNEMMIALLIQGFTMGETLDWYCERGGEHSEVSWSQRLWRPFFFLLGRV